MNIQLLVIAKEPVPGLVKTRLCPPCTPEQAAAVARAALDQTLATVDSIPSSGRVLVLRGRYDPPSGWRVVGQRGDGLADRLANGFADAGAGEPSLLVGMDTPQLTPALVGSVSGGLAQADAVIAPALDGGWWALALRNPTHAEALRCVQMSTSDTYRDTVQALVARGLNVVHGPRLRDVDTAVDAVEVAAALPGSRFAAAVRAHVPVTGRIADGRRGTGQMAAPLAVYAAALRDAAAGADGRFDLMDQAGEAVAQLDSGEWTGGLLPGDGAMLARCEGSTLDVGCGPGRLAAALRRAGRAALGVDICAEAVRQARRRGARAIRGNVFAPLPREGQWSSLLLADGNIGIGGDPQRLLRRCAGLVHRGGAVLVELRPPGHPSWSVPVRMRHGGLVSNPFPWAALAADDAPDVAHRAGLQIRTLWTEAGRWFAQLKV